MKRALSTAILVLGYIAMTNSLFAQGKISGELKQWHRITITFKGPESSETAEENPFFDYRLNVTFTHAFTGKSYTVPGYFAADGDAGNTGADSGNRWRVHFAADETGEWSYAVDFRKGNWVAVSDKEKTGQSGDFMDGETGSFTVAPTDKTGADFRGKGRLQYADGHYLRFAGTGEYFLKCGADAPENFLAYADFDGTFHNDGHKDDLVKSWEPHLKDWKEGDPTWKEGKGKAMIGALNYLASEGMNAFSFLTLNIRGDDQNVFPYIDYDTHDRMDVSKLDQWEVVFEHAQHLGLFLHFKTQEVENQGLLDGGGTGAYRKLYYRELIARFGHHLALNWNMGEEIGDWIKNHPTPPQFKQERLAMARYFYDHDPYHHHVVIHNGAPFNDILGTESKYTGISLQTHKPTFELVHGDVLKWRRLSAAAGKPWAIAVDEPGDAQHALLPDHEDPEHNLARQNGLWGALTAGAWGLEWYFGYKHDHSDLSCQDYRSRDLFWDQCRHALTFFNQYDIPYWNMEPCDGISSTGYCFASPSDTYVLYIPKGGTAELQPGEGTYEVKWYDPRNGGLLQDGTVDRVEGCGLVSIGQAPSEPDRDWVALVRSTEKRAETPCGQAIVLEAITDFPDFRIEGFAPAYRDGNNRSLAINAANFTGQTAAASHRFEGAAGLYDISLVTLLETDGESVYRVKVGENILCDFVNPATSEDYIPSGQTWRSVRVNTGEVIRVEFSSETNGKIPEGDTTAFSRGRWTTLKLQPVCSPDSYDPEKEVYLEKDGLVVIDAGSGEPAGNWKRYTHSGELKFLDGFSGAGCIRFLGNTEVSGPPDSPVTYTIKIKTPGKYRLKMRALEAPLETGQGDKANDCYLKLEGADGWHGEFTKFVLLGESYQWSWNVMGEPRHHEFEPPGYDLKKGAYKIQIAGRSKNFVADRIILYRTGDFNEEEISWPGN